MDIIRLSINFVTMNIGPTSVRLPVTDDRIVPNTIPKLDTLLTYAYDNIVASVA